jgi:hypothetical protein
MIIQPLRLLILLILFCLKALLATVVHPLDLIFHLRFRQRETTQLVLAWVTCCRAAVRTTE